MGRIDWDARFTVVGERNLDSTRQLAQALTCQEARLTNGPSSGARAYKSDLAYSMSGVVRPQRSVTFFGESPKRKVLCSCGAIAEVDQSIATKKISLGKAMECRACRNERIAREREDLERHFNGQVQEEEGW